jgi:hypothetical protein
MVSTMRKFATLLVMVCSCVQPSTQGENDPNKREDFAIAASMLDDFLGGVDPNLVACEDGLCCAIVNGGVCCCNPRTGCTCSILIPVQPGEAVAGGGDDPCISDPIAPGGEPLADPDALCHPGDGTRSQATLNAASNAARRAGLVLGQRPAASSVDCGTQPDGTYMCTVDWDLADGTPRFVRGLCVIDLANSTWCSAYWCERHDAGGYTCMLIP